MSIAADTHAEHKNHDVESAPSSFGHYLERITGFRFFAALGAALAAIAPAVMATAQDGELEGAISDYWDVDPSHYFWFPFGLAGILLTLDGLISMAAPKQRKYRSRWFNVILGISLLLLTAFNKDEVPSVHYPAATVFFSLFIVVIGYTSLLGTTGHHHRPAEKAGDERVERASAVVSSIFFALLALTLVFWWLGLISFYFFELFALLNFALFHIQGSMNPFPYHHYEFKIDWLNRILRKAHLMAPRHQAL